MEFRLNACRCVKASCKVFWVRGTLYVDTYKMVRMRKREFLVIRIPRSLTCSCLTSSFPTQQLKSSISQDLNVKCRSGDHLLQKHFHNGSSTTKNTFTFTKGRRQPSFVWDVPPVSSSIPPFQPVAFSFRKLSEKGQFWLEYRSKFRVRN